MIDLLYCALRNLGRKRFRSILTVIGISVGVASVIVISTLGDGGKAAMSGELDSLGINGLNISQKKDSVNDTALMTVADVKTCKNVYGVKEAMPLIMQMGDAVLRNIRKDTLFWGVGDNAEDLLSLKIVYGRMFSHSDLTSRARVCLVDDTFAKTAYKRTNVIGKTISLSIGGAYEDFKICGIIESGSSLLYNLVGGYMPTFVYLPYSTAENLRNEDGYDQVVIKTGSGVNLDKTGNRITSILDSQHNSGNYVASNMLKQKQKMFYLLDIATLLITAVGAISLIVAGLGIMTVMLVSVNERTREIGIKKAIGARKSVIMFEFMLESMTISVAGGIAGVSAGCGISYLVSKIMKFSYSFNLFAVLEASLFAITIGILFGMYPAYKAASLQPAVALRSE